MARNEDFPTVEHVYREGKELMRRGGHRLGVLTPGGPEDIRFRGFFGANVATVIDAWKRMGQHGLLPAGLLFVHYLWALLFMCLYPKNEHELCTLVGGYDPKTVRAKTWPFIHALYELNNYVVSSMMPPTAACIILINEHLTRELYFFTPRFCLEIGS